MIGEFFEPIIEIAAGETPFERLGDLFIMALELSEAFCDGCKGWEVVRCKDLLLQDGEVNFDLVEPTGMHRPMHEH